MSCLQQQALQTRLTPRTEEHLDKVVKLLREVSRQEPAFGRPLEQATTAINTLNVAIHNVFLQYKGNGTNPTGGYRYGGPRYGGPRFGGRRPGGYRI